MAVHSSISTISTTVIVIASLLSVAFGSAAVAAEAPPSVGAAAFAIQVPQGLSVEVLDGEGDPGSATMTGCPVSGLVYFRAEYHYLMDGNTFVLPILYTKDIPVRVDGVATVPLAPISTWLDMNDPERLLSSIVLSSDCVHPVSEPGSGSEAVAQATLIIPFSSVSLEGPPLPPVPSGTPSATPSTQVPAVEAEPSASATPTPVLAATGYSAAAGLTGLGALVSLAGIALIALVALRRNGSAREFALTASLTSD